MTVTANTNRAAVLHAPGDMRAEERGVPAPAAGEVLIEVRAVGVCGSDVHYYEHGQLGDFVVRDPLVLGHECSGEISALGSGVRELEPGQRVAVEPGFACLACDQCRQGRYNLCPHVCFFATPPVDGAFQQYVTVPEMYAYPVPDTMSDDAAALLEPLSVAMWTCTKAGVTAGSRVLVTGAGPVGLLATQTAKALGAAEVVVSDVQADRLTLARALGADTTIDASVETLAATTDLAPDTLLECSGNQAAAGEAVRLVRPAGRVVLVGMGADEVRLPLPVVQQRELWVTGTFRYANTWPAARSLAAAGSVDLDRLVTGHFPLDDAEASLRATRDDRDSVKPIVCPQR